MGTPPDRLATFMDQQRLHLGLEWRDVAERAGVSYETLRTLRKTGQASPLSKRKLENSLRWSQDSIDRVLGGGDPLPFSDDPDAPHDVDEDMVLLPRDLLVQIRQTLRRAEQIISRELDRQPPEQPREERRAAG